MTKDNSKKHSSVNNCTTDGDKDRKNSHDCCQTGLCQKTYSIWKTVPFIRIYNIELHTGAPMNYGFERE